MFDNKKKSDEKLVGAFLPQRFRRYLTLYCLCNGTTKSDVIRDTLVRWERRQKKKANEDDLIAKLQKDLIKHQEALYHAQRMGKDTFVRTYSDALRRKGLQKDDVKRIMSVFNEEKSK